MRCTASSCWFYSGVCGADSCSKPTAGRATIYATTSPARQLLDSAGIAYTVHCEVGDRVDCIVETARRLQCDAIVMGTARKSSLVRLVENSVTNQVLERTSVPVEVIAGEAASRLERVGIPAGVGTGAGLLALWMAAN
nr:universal stress protein [Comamonas aquatica]